MAVQCMRPGWGRTTGVHAVPCTQLYRIVGGRRWRGSQPTSADQGRPVLHGAQGGGGVARGLHAAPEGEGGGMGVGRGRAFSYIGANEPCMGACRIGNVDSENRPQRGQFLPDLVPRCLRCRGAVRAAIQTGGWSCLERARPAAPGLLAERNDSILRGGSRAVVWPWLQARCPPRCGPCTSSTGSRQSPSGSFCAWGFSRLVVTQEHRRQCRPAL